MKSLHKHQHKTRSQSFPCSPIRPSQEYKLETAFYQESKAKSRSIARETDRMVGTRENITSEILISLYFEAFTSLGLKLQQVEVQKHTSTLQRSH